MNIDQIAAEAAAKIHSALLHNVTDEQVEFIQAIIKDAIEKAYEAGWHIGIADKLELRAAHASEKP